MTQADVFEGKKPSRRRFKSHEHLLSELLTYVCSARWSGMKAEKTLVLNAKAVVNILGGNILVSSITKLDALKIKQTLASKGNSDSTINRKLAALSTLLHEAVELGWRDKSFKVGLTKERNNRIRYFSEEEEADMIGWCERWHYLDLRDYIVVALDTGMRRGEVLKILKSDVGKSNLWTWDTKSGRSRDIPLTQRARLVLERRAGLTAGANQRVFDVPTHRLREYWLKMQTALGFTDDTNYTPHVMRHTFVTRLLERGVDIKTVQELAGHERIETTQRYAHSSADRKVRAIRMLG